MTIGPGTDPKSDMGPLVTRAHFEKVKAYVDTGVAEGAKLLVDGRGIKVSGHEEGFFLGPCLFDHVKPHMTIYLEEIFGPVLTIYVYNDEDYLATLSLVDQTSEYALTGSIMAKDRYAIEQATSILENAAGNFYINDKPTGAVVGQQPFGGARGSGTNDKAGAAMNLLRWVSARTIKETFATPTDYRYPFLEK